MAPGVIYLSHIPHGFYEKEMKSYFTQFGDVTRLRISRSKKSGNSRGYAFIEFEDEDVAQIVAESMNNYLLFDKLLKCEVVTPERLHKDTFKNSDTPISICKAPNRSKYRYNEGEAVDNNTRKYLEHQKVKLNKLKERLEKLGCKLDIEVPEFVPSLSDSQDGGDETTLDQGTPRKKIKKEKTPSQENESRGSQRKMIKKKKTPSQEKESKVTPGQNTINVKENSLKSNLDGAVELKRKLKKENEGLSNDVFKTPEILKRSTATREILSGRKGKKGPVTDSPIYMEMDSTDAEITIKTPPGVIKRKKGQKIIRKTPK